MARLPRLAIDLQLHHLVHRALPGGQLFSDDVDRQGFASALLTVSRDLSIAVHAHVLLPDRVQLLLTPRQGADIALFMQRLGRRHVGALNARHGRSGSPWAGRYRITVLQPERYLVDAMRLIDTAPVLAGLVNRAEDWPSSSAAHHFGRQSDPVVSDHPLFWALGNTPFEREMTYRRLCEQPVAAASSTAIAQSTERGWALGDAGFIAALEAQQARRLQPQKRGRPAHARPPDQSDPI